ncbi:MFS transporter [Pseudomonas sp. App30]
MGGACTAKSRYHKRLFACLATDTMTENDYFLAWGIYAFAAFGCLMVWLRLTTWIWRWLRQPLRIVMAVLLFTPTIVDPGKGMFAPAVAMTALDILFKDAGHALPAMSDLAMYSLIALVLYVIYALIRWPIERSSRARRAEQAARDEALAKADAQRRDEPDEPFAAGDRYGRTPPTPTPPSPAGRMRVEPRL